MRVCQPPPISIARSLSATLLTEIDFTAGECDVAGKFRRDRPPIVTSHQECRGCYLGVGGRVPENWRSASAMGTRLMLAVPTRIKPLVELPSPEFIA